MPDSIDLGSYSVFVPPDPFEDHVGPFYYRIKGDAREAGSVHCVLPTQERHGNYAGGVHGGATLAFAVPGIALAQTIPGHHPVRPPGMHAGTAVPTMPAPTMRNMS